MRGRHEADSGYPGIDRLRKSNGNIISEVLDAAAIAGVE
jgi:hypothetical protein